MKWQAQHVLDGTRLFKRQRAMPAALRRADHLPVGRPITRAAKTRGVDERLQPINGMRLQPLPVVRDKLGHATQKVRRQVFHAHPRQDQKATVVSNEANVAPPRF